MRVERCVAWLVILLAGTMASAASAQTPTGTEGAQPDTNAATTTPGPDAATTAPAVHGSFAEATTTDQQALTEEEGVDVVHDGTDPWEDPHGSYYFAGAFYRQLIVPQFLLNLFTEKSVMMSNPAFGVELTYRKAGFDIIGSLWWGDFSVTGPFRSADEPEAVNTEWIESDLNMIFASAAFLWSTPFNDVFALEYGVDVGFGLVFGDLRRTEAYDDDGVWRKCEGPGDPVLTYCEMPQGEDAIRRGTNMDGEEGEHYNILARKWADGGSIPNVVPWIAVPHVALRIKPIHQLMMRIEGGFGLGFFAGFSASYGI